MRVDFLSNWINIHVKKRHRFNRGQSTIEFLLGFSIVFLLILLLLRVAINYTNGYFLHYATFMASRTYMVVDVNDKEATNDQNAERRARDVFNKFLVPSLIPSFSTEIQFQSPEFGGKTIFSGAYAEYKEKFSPVSVMGGNTEMTLRSESFLRREPGRAHCLEQICKAMDALGVTCGPKHITFYDNGC